LQLAREFYNDVRATFKTKKFIEQPLPRKETAKKTADGKYTEVA